MDKHISHNNLPEAMGWLIEKVNNLENLIRENGLILHQEKDKKEVLTAKETAAYLNVTLPTIHTWAKQGKLTKHKVGGTRIGFKRAEVEKLLIKVEARKR